MTYKIRIHVNYIRFIYIFFISKFRNLYFDRCWLYLLEGAFWDADVCCSCLCSKSLQKKNFVRLRQYQSKFMHKIAQKNRDASGQTALTSQTFGDILIMTFDTCGMFPVFLNAPTSWYVSKFNSYPWRHPVLEKYDFLATNADKMRTITYNHL